MGLRLDTLNPEQRSAVTAVDGPVLLLAGAGTGKTRVITFRAAYLVEQGVPPKNMLLVTFTNKAAREMKERLGQLMERSAAEAIKASTFHSFCAQVLRRHISKAGYSSEFEIAPQGYQTGLVKTVLSELGLAGRSAPTGYYKHCISTAKSKVMWPQSHTFSVDEGWPKDFAKVYELYQQRMRNMNMVDFDDLLILTIHLWDEYPDVLEQYREQYKYLMVDEYQDTNAAQFQLIQRLAAGTDNVCAVGDDDQSIYGWRGAELANIGEFQNQFENCRVIRLEQNYRSTNNILNAANSVIKSNSYRHDKKLWSQKGEGGKISVVRTEDERKEAEFLVDYIKDRSVDMGNKYNGFAVLYRSNHQSRLIEEALRKAHVPYELIGSRSFYDRREIVDAMSFLRVLNNPYDNMSFLRIINVPPRGIGDTSVKKLRRLQHITGKPLQELARSDDFRETVSPKPAAALTGLMQVIDKYRKIFREHSELRGNVNNFLQDIGYLEGLLKMYKPRSDALRRYDNVIEFLESLSEFQTRNPGSGLSEFLEAFSLIDQNDKSEESEPGEKNAVSLLTVHAAKGLEFPVVAVCGMEHGLFPHQRALEEGSVEEERRLFYVAMTRAQDELILTHTDKRQFKGKPRSRRVSGFVKEVDDDYTVYTDPDEALQPASQDVAEEYLEQMKEMFKV